MAELGLRRTTGNRVYQEWYRGFESLSLRHVVASFTWLATIFLFHKQIIASPCFAVHFTPFRYIGAVARFPRVAMPPFRKKSRSARLFACKRAYDAVLSLPTFCGLAFPMMSDYREAD